MGIMSIGLSTSATSSESLYGVRLRPGSPPTIYVKWQTESGTDWNEDFDISVSWRAVPKGITGTGDNGYTTWASFRYDNHIPASRCHPTQNAGSDYWQWGIDLAQLGTIPSGSTTTDGDDMGSILAPNGWGFSYRIWDAINLQVHIKSHYPDGKVDHMGRTGSLLAENNSLWIGYFPEYELTGAYYTLGGLTVEYEVPGWTRLDDRWGLEGLSQGGADLRATDNFWVDVVKVGELPIPPSALTRMPTPGQPITVEIRMNAGFRDIGMDFGLVSGTVTLEDRSVCDTPTITVTSATADAIVATITDSGDKGVPFDHAVVKLAGSVYDSDTQVVEPGGTVTIALPPLGVPLELQAYGYTDVAVSGIASKSVAALPAATGLSVRAVDGSCGVELRFNVSESWSFEAEMERAKFAGRERDSVAYGTGGTVTGTLGCDIIDDASYGALHQSRTDFERLAFAGTCVIRGSDGERRMVAVESVGESWDTVRRSKTMRISVREV